MNFTRISYELSAAVHISSIKFLKPSSRYGRSRQSTFETITARLFFFRLVRFIYYQCNMIIIIIIIIIMTLSMVKYMTKSMEVYIYLLL